MKNPLNAVDGNTLNIEEVERDLYDCPCCDGYVPEDEWNSKRNVCFSCWWRL